jgi:hypothetical protein
VNIVSTDDPVGIADTLLQEYAAWSAGVQTPIARDLSALQTRERMAADLLEVLHTAIA